MGRISYREPLPEDPWAEEESIDSPSGCELPKACSPLGLVPLFDDPGDPASPIGVCPPSPIGAPVSLGGVWESPGVFAPSAGASPEGASPPVCVPPEPWPWQANESGGQLGRSAKPF